MGNKEKLIQEYLQKPIEVGDRILYTRDKGGYRGLCTFSYVVTSMNEDTISFNDGYGEFHTTPKNEVVKDTAYIGANPHKELPICIIEFSIRELLHKIGYDIASNTFQYATIKGDVPVQQVNFDCTIIDNDGAHMLMQPNWSLLKKQKLIKSCYSIMDLGHFIFRDHTVKWIQNRIDNGRLKGTSLMDMIDGKQRLYAIIEFIQNEFPDEYGNYYRDLSDDAQKNFLGTCLYYCYTENDCSDEVILDIYKSYNY